LRYNVDVVLVRSHTLEGREYTGLVTEFGMASFKSAWKSCLWRVPFKKFWARDWQNIWFARLVGQVLTRTELGCYLTVFVIIIFEGLYKLS